MVSGILVVTGSLCLVLALVEAWTLVAVLSDPSTRLSKWIPGSQDMIKSHVDFLMMSLLLFVYYLLFDHFRITAPTFVIVGMCIGSVSNPLLFLARAVNPAWREEPTPALRLTAMVSFALATVGYGAAAWLVACSALASIRA